MLFTCAAAGRLKLPDGAVLVIEDVTELSYRIDRMLTAILTSGALNRVAAVIVGEFTDCPPGPSGVGALDVVRERLSPMQVPLIAGFPCGHGLRNVPVPLGCPALVDADRGVVVFNP
jgi:muramoyltetrapeptide carboxypeptidase